MADDFGRGETVGIVEFGEPNSNADINTFKSCYGIHTNISYHKLDGFNRTGFGAGEAALDIETVASMAPNVNIIVYQAPNTGKAAFDIYRVMVDSDRARVISESYGLCEHYQDPRAANAVTNLYLQAAVQGQTIVASSGDSGSEGCVNNDGVPTRLSVNFPASNPFVLSVGGTTVFDITARPGETVWNANGGASGGGKSVFYRQPGYQHSFGINSGVREVPDVSADADLQGLGQAPQLADSRHRARQVGNGYWVVSSNGHVYAFGGAKNHGGATNDGKIVGIALDRQTGGYWIATASGRVIARDARNRGSKRLRNVTGIAGNPRHEGYWLVTASGGVHAFGVPNFGGMPFGGVGKTIGIAGDPTFGGYFLATSNGHVAAINAVWHGDHPGTTSAITGIAASN